MGDIVELTTLPREQKVFYKVPTGGLKFAVKGANNAAIGIHSKKESKSVNFWVVLGRRQCTWLRSTSGSCKAHTPNILSPAEYRSFWISWSNLAVSIGREGEKEPILTIPEKHSRDLCYVTFFVNSRGFSPVHWKFELAPEIPRPIEKRIDGGTVRWVRSENQVPWNAIIGGYEHETLYIIRALHRGSLAVGKFVPSKRVGYIPWGSESHEKRGAELEFLVGYDCHWVPTSGSEIPVGAIVGGYTEHQPGENIYVARAYCRTHLIPGKVHRMYGQCYTPYENKEFGHSNYEVLVSPEINQRSMKIVFTDHISIDTPTGSDVGESDEDGIVEEYDDYYNL